MDAQWFDYAKLLYERPQEENTPPFVNTTKEISMVEDIKIGIKNLANGKARDIDGLQAEFLKWGVEILAPHIKYIFNHVSCEGFSLD